VYVIDTGIMMTHEDFEGRAITGYDFHNNKEDATDDNGHGEPSPSSLTSLTERIS
jgi:subtilisin family serine protease